MSDIWSALRPQLETFTGSLPLAALAEADAHRDELAPQLVAELQHIAADPTAAEADGYVLHLYAMLLLARWRDSRAYAPLAELGHLDEAAIDAVFGQLGHASYGRALASTCDGDIAPLTALADDADASAWARSAALEALTLAAVEHRAPAAPVADFLADFGARQAEALRGNQDTSADIQLLDLVVTHLADLGATDYLPAIHEWFAAGLVDETFADPADIEADIHRPAAERIAALRRVGHGLIDDVAHEIADWPDIFHLPPVALRPIPLGAIREPVRREEAKVGRNDPCPCGSGRKYKKCHGAT